MLSIGVISVGQIKMVTITDVARILLIRAIGVIRKLKIEAIRLIRMVLIGVIRINRSYPPKFGILRQLLLTNVLYSIHYYDMVQGQAYYSQCPSGMTADGCKRVIKKSIKS